MEKQKLKPFRELTLVQWIALAGIIAVLFIALGIAAFERNHSDVVNLQGQTQVLAKELAPILTPCTKNVDSPRCRALRIRVTRGEPLLVACTAAHQAHVQFRSDSPCPALLSRR